VTLKDFMEKERIIEILIALMFITLLFIFILLGLGVNSQKSNKTSITNSYNTFNNYCENCNAKETSLVAPIESLPEIVYEKQIVVREFTQNQEELLEKGFFYLDSRRTYASGNCEKKFLNDCPKQSPCSEEYSSEGNHKKEFAFGSYSDTFRVWVDNRGYSDYFTVKYSFSDCSGKEKEYEMRKYISFGDKEEFYFRDISRNIDQYCSWKYQVYRD